MKIRCSTTSAIKLPFSAIQDVMMYQGFNQTRFNQNSAYRARFDDTSTKRSYRLTIPIQNHDNFTCSVKVADAYFEETESIPPEIVEAAESKLYEVNAYLQDERERQTTNVVEMLK